MALAAVTEIAASEAVDHQHRWLIVIAVMLGTVLEMIDTSIINVALPHMQGSFSASVDEITWVVTSYLVANGIMIPLIGWISARFGRKRYFLFSVTTFVMASACCGAARSLDQMVIFRLLQGFAGAAMLPSSKAIMMETFPPEEQSAAAPRLPGSPAFHLLQTGIPNRVQGLVTVGRVGGADVLLKRTLTP